MSRLVRSGWTWLVVTFVLLTSLPDGSALHVGVLAVVAVGWLAFLALRQPAAAAGLIVVGAAYLGGPAVLMAPPLVLLLGYRATRSFRSGPAPGQWRRLAVVALLAALATIPFAGLGYERAEPSPSGSRGARSGAEPGVGGSSLLEAIARLLRRLPPPPDDPARRWWLWVLAALVLLALVAIVVWLIRRRRRAVGLATASVVARLESVGRRVGRRRRPDEGVLSYASALAARTGDQRLGLAGPEVSALVYRSGAASGERVEQALASLEEVPPPKPPRRSLPDRWRSVRSGIRVRLTPQRAMVALAGVVLLVGAVGVAVPRLSRLDGPADGAWSLWAEPPSQVEQWWSCATFDGESAARTGIDDLTRERSATRTRFTAGTTVYEVDEATWDGESSMAYDGDEPFLVDDWLVRPWRPFADLDQVLERFDLADAVVATHRDAAGAPYTRYESMPLTEPEKGLAAVEHVGARWETSVVWVLDVWLDPAGRPVHLRQMVDGDPGRWEWLLLDEPTGDSNPPTCGVEAASAPGGPRQGPWLGAEPWAPTLEVPLQVAYDASGHPYDLTRWSTEATWSTLGSLRSPGGTVTISALELLDAEADPDNWSGTVAVEPGTTIRVDHYGNEAVDGHHLVLSSPGGAGGAVVAWRLLGEADLTELTPVLLVIPPGLDPERLEAAYGELSIEDLLGDRLDLDGDGADDTMVVAQYGGLTRVYAGEDATGRVVELASLTEGLPWRVLGLPGEAPADVLERERELAECVAGTRPTGADGVCERS